MRAAKGMEETLVSALDAAAGTGLGRGAALHLATGGRRYAPPGIARTESRHPAWTSFGTVRTTSPSRRVSPKKPRHAGDRLLRADSCKEGVRRPAAGAGIAPQIPVESWRLPPTDCGTRRRGLHCDAQNPG